MSGTLKRPRGVTVSEEISNSEIVISLGNVALAVAAVGQAMFVMFDGGLWKATPIFLAQVFVAALLIGAHSELGLGGRPGVMSGVRLGVAGLLVALFGILGLIPLAGLSVLVSIATVLGLVVLSGIVGQFLNLGQAQRGLMAISCGSLTGISIDFSAAFAQGEIIFGSLPALGMVMVAGSYLLRIGLIQGRREIIVSGVMLYGVSLMQLALLFNITPAYSITIGMSLIGVAIMIVTRVGERLGKASSSGLCGNASSLSMQIGSLAVVAGAAASILFVFPKLLQIDSLINDCGLLLFQSLPLALAYFINRHPAWRNAFGSVGILNLIMVAISLAMVSTIPMIYRVELAVLAVGIATLAAGHVGWYREQVALDQSDSPESLALISNRFASVSANLVMGALLVAIPMISGLVMVRILEIETKKFWKWFHEMGGLVIGLMLLGSGNLCKIRSTTIAGFAMLSTFVVSLVVLIRIPEALQSVSVMMMAGGGLFFAIAIVLSIYRDWVLGLPAKIKEGEGVFKVLKWR